MKVRNLGVAVRPIKEERPTEQGGIIIPTTAKITSNNREGVVVATGEGTKGRPMEVRIGETILYKKGNYPTAEDCEIIDLNDVLYVL